MQSAKSGGGEQATRNPSRELRRGMAHNCTRPLKLCNHEEHFSALARALAGDISRPISGISPDINGISPVIRALSGSKFGREPPKLRST
jgi:hypothetical protein